MLLRFSDFLLLIENRVEWMKKNTKELDTSHDPNAVHKSTEDIIDHFATKADPSTNKQHTQWVVGQYRKGIVRQEDHPRIKETLQNFDKHRQRLVDKDINRYKTIGDLETALEPHIEANVVSKKQEKRDIKETGATQIYNSPTMSVHKLNTQEGAMAYGAGTKWCTAAKKNNMFDTYNKDGPLFVISNKVNNQKFQYHPASDQFARSDDSNMGFQGGLEAMPEIRKVDEFHKHKHAWLMKPEHELKDHFNNLVITANKKTKFDREAMKHPLFHKAIENHFDAAVNSSNGELHRHIVTDKRLVQKLSTDHINKVIDASSSEGGSRINVYHSKLLSAPNFNSDHMTKVIHAGLIGVNNEDMLKHPAYDQNVHGRAFRESDNIEDRMASFKIQAPTHSEIHKTIDDVGKFNLGDSGSPAYHFEKHIDQLKKFPAFDSSHVDRVVERASHFLKQASHPSSDSANMTDAIDIANFAAELHPYSSKADIDKINTKLPGIYSRQMIESPHFTKEHYAKAIEHITSKTKRGIYDPLGGGIHYDMANSPHFTKDVHDHVLNTAPHSAFADYLMQYSPHTSENDVTNFIKKTVTNSPDKGMAKAKLYSAASSRSFNPAKHAPMIPNDESLMSTLLDTPSVQRNKDLWKTSFQRLLKTRPDPKSFTPDLQHMTHVYTLNNLLSQNTSVLRDHGLHSIAATVTPSSKINAEVHASFFKNLERGDQTPTTTFKKFLNSPLTNADDVVKAYKTADNPKVIAKHKNFSREAFNKLLDSQEPIERKKELMHSIHFDPKNPDHIKPFAEANHPATTRLLKQVTGGK